MRFVATRNFSAAHAHRMVMVSPWSVCLSVSELLFGMRRAFIKSGAVCVGYNWTHFYCCYICHWSPANCFMYCWYFLWITCNLACWIRLLAHINFRLRSLWVVNYTSDSCEPSLWNVHGSNGFWLVSSYCRHVPSLFKNPDGWVSIIGPHYNFLKLWIRGLVVSDDYTRKTLRFI